MKKEATFEIAKKVIDEFPEEEHYIQAHFQQFLTFGEYDDNSIELSDYWNKCKVVFDKQLQQPLI